MPFLVWQGVWCLLNKRLIFARVRDVAGHQAQRISHGPNNQLPSWVNSSCTLFSHECYWNDTYNMSLLCSEARNDSLMPTGGSTNVSILHLPSSMIYSEEFIVQEPKSTRLSAEYSWPSISRSTSEFWPIVDWTGCYRTVDTEEWLHFVTAALGKIHQGNSAMGFCLFVSLFVYLFNFTQQQGDQLSQIAQDWGIFFSQELSVLKLGKSQGNGNKVVTF